MSRPVYIICSAAGSEDKETGLVSLFGIVESIQFARLPAGRPLPLAINTLPMLRITSCWMRGEAEEPNAKYEFQIAIFVPPQAQETVVFEGQFIFALPFQRILGIIPTPTFTAAGLLRVECRIRRLGTKEWLKQDCPILVMEAAFSEPEAVAQEPSPASVQQ